VKKSTLILNIFLLLYITFLIVYGNVPDCHIDEWNFFSNIVEFKKHSIFINHHVDEYSKFNLIPFYNIIYSIAFYFFDISIFSTCLVQVIIFALISYCLNQNKIFSFSSFIILSIGVLSTLSYQGMRPEALGALIVLIPLTCMKNKIMHISIASVFIAIAFLVSVRTLPMSLLYIATIHYINKDYTKKQVSVNTLKDLVILYTSSLIVVIFLYKLTGGNFGELIEVLLKGVSKMSHTLADNQTFIALLQRPVGIVSYVPLVCMSLFLLAFNLYKRNITLLIIGLIPLIIHILGSYIYYTIFLVIVTNYIIVNYNNLFLIKKFLLFFTFSSSLPILICSIFTFSGIRNNMIEIINLDRGLASISSSENLIIDAKTAKFVFDYNPPCSSRILGYHNTKYPEINKELLPHQSSITSYNKGASVKLLGIDFPSQKYRPNLFIYNKPEMQQDPDD
jgi:hypothetical protein